jgi:hypothetical protein
MDPGRRVKGFESKSGGCRIRIRPRLGWLGDVVKDLREMKFKRWRQKAADGEIGKNGRP